uniref:Methyltransferase domain-containing protein n=1 Tax=mine drainage metagenome TaxID=410659 RepID=E6PX29_9ZZZZ
MRRIQEADRISSAESGSSKSAPPDFDNLVQVYRWMEYSSFGPYLERCRFWFLGAVGERRHALVLGDGDGRFTARLLAQSPDLRVHAIDGSAGMLAALRRRARRYADRLTTEQADLRRWWPAAQTAAPEIIVSHFFLDCLTTEEVAALATRLAGSCAPNALWLVSEFAIPVTGWMQRVARPLITLLYRAFRLLTNLGPQRLPDYAAALEASGWRLEAERQHLHGLLVSQLWRAPKS